MMGSARIRSAFCIVLAFLPALLLLFRVDTAKAQGNLLSSPRRLITESIDETKVVRLEGNTRPEANAENDRGPVSDDFALAHMQIQLRLPLEKEQELEQLIGELHDPNSPGFHHWLTADEFRQRFSPAPEDIEAVSSWLQSHGFTVNVMYPRSIDFSGTAGQLRDAFRTAIHALQVNGTAHIANMNDPQIPAALAPIVAGVFALNDFMPRPMMHPRAAYTVAVGSYPVVPADLATIYNFNPLFAKGYSGQGQTIVVIEDSDVYNAADWSAFRSTLGLSSYTSGSFAQVHPSPPIGSNNCSDPGANEDDSEAIIDAEWASAAAPNATVMLASCGNTTDFGGFIALENLLNASGTPPAIVSISYGAAEAELGFANNAAIKALYQQAVAEGVSVFAALGDQGAAGADPDASSATHGIGVSGFASTPYNVSVGGTDFGDTYAIANATYWSSSNASNYGSAESYVPEIPWNDSCASGLLASYLNFESSSGSGGLCNSLSGAKLLTTAAGSGGPSGCATGTPAPPTSGIVGGSCAGYAKPSWQSLVGNPSDGVRDTPDVSLFAGNGIWGHYYIVCYSDVSHGGAACSGAPSMWSVFGGTSFASPILAGIQALVNQETGSSWGNPNPTYYALAGSEYGTTGSPSCNSTLGNATAISCIFYDVTQGDMDVDCTGTQNCYLPSGTYGVLSTSSSSFQRAYGTGTGWDFATGIGSVNAYNLVANWPGSPLMITTASLPSGEVGTAYSTMLIATGGTTPYTWSLSSGELPSGLTLNLSTGLISGTPTAVANATALTFKVTDSGSPEQTVTFSPTLTIRPAPLTITTPSLPSGTVGVLYSQILAATGGIAPYTWALSLGTLPGGLTLNPSTGLISGTPTAIANATPLAFKVSDSSSPAQTTNVNLTLTISSPVLTITKTSLASGQVGTGYSQTLTATGGTAPYTWALSLGTLPGGLTLNSSTGLISGTPTAVVNATPLAFEVADSSSPTQTTSVSLTLTIFSATLTITTASLANGQVGTGYAQTLTATGGTAPYTWALSLGTLPGGLTLNSSTGLISGTPTAVANGTALAFKVADSSSPTQTTSVSLTLTIFSAMLTITTAALANGQVGTGYAETLTATGGTTPYTWAVASGTLPAGLALNSLTGLISGTPTAAANAAVVAFKVTDSGSPAQTASTSLTCTIAPAPLTITTPFLPNGTVGTSYSQALAATGGTTPYTWALASGTLPVGLALNSSTGLITGIPTGAVNNTALVFKVADSSSPPQTANASLTLTTVFPFTVTFGASALSISSSGGSSNALVTIAPVGGFTGTVNLTCSVTYTGQGVANDPPTCSLSAAQINLPSSTNTSTITVNTTPAASALSTPPRTDPISADWSARCETPLMLAVVLGMLARRRRLKTRVVMLLFVCFAVSFGCGGGGSSSSVAPGNLGTTVGNYAVTVTATGTGLLASTSATISLSVQ